MVNSCNFIGRLGRDPETRYTQSGKAVASFSLACSEKRGGEETTEWVNVVTWEKLAEICGQYLVKGSLVFISGRMQTRKWQDKDGGTRYTTEIIARDMQMLSPKGEQNSGGGRGDVPDAPPMGDDSVPF
jgi:single-strand DNA-binding protein